MGLFLLLLVIILSIGISILEGAGQASGGVAQTGTQLAAGTLVLTPTALEHLTGVAS